MESVGLPADSRQQCRALGPQTASGPLNPQEVPGLSSAGWTVSSSLTAAGGSNGCGFTEMAGAADGHVDPGRVRPWTLSDKAPATTDLEVGDKSWGRTT